MKHLEFLAKISVGLALFTSPAIAQYSELADRDNPQAQQRALMQRIEQQESRIQMLEKEVYALRKQMQSQSAASARLFQSTPQASAVASRSRAGMHTYIVREGDTLHNIAMRNGISVKDLMTLNGLQSPDTIFLGSELVIPGPGSGAPASKPATPAPPAKSAAAASKPGPSGSGRYTVRSGDTMVSIATRHGVTIEDIRATNQLKDPNRIAIGQELIIPSPGASAAPAKSPKSSVADSKEKAKAPSADNPFPSGYAYYTVSQGDSLYSIARLFGTTEKRIEELNNLTRGATIHPEDQILVPMDNYKGPYTETASTN